MKRCNFQNNYGVISDGKICSCAPIFNFFLRANLYQKIPILETLGAVGPHFLTHESEIWHEGANCEPGIPLQSQIL